MIAATAAMLVTPDYYRTLLCELFQATPGELGFGIQELLRKSWSSGAGQIPRVLTSDYATWRGY